MLQVENLSYSYHRKNVLNAVSFSFEKGQSVCLLGRNGVGKSTLFKCLLGLLKPSNGAITILGKRLQDYSLSELAATIAYIPQKQTGIFHFTVNEMVLMGTTPQLKMYQQPGEKEQKMVDSALEKLNIFHLKENYFSELSGGEQQLVIIARSIVQKSRILLMDEPCANLDYGNQLMVLDLIQQLSNEGYLIIQSTHDPNHALQYAEQVMILDEGKLIQTGRPENVLTSDLMQRLYGVSVSITSIQKNQPKVCVPKQSKEYTHVDII